jgi:hypothetical protein
MTTATRNASPEGASVAAGASVAGASVGAGAPAPHALRTSVKARIMLNNHMNFFIFFSLDE